MIQKNKDMDGKQHDEYLEFTKKFLDTIDVENYITKHIEVSESMKDIDDDYIIQYKAFCEEAEKNGTLPDIVKEEDPTFFWVFNVMDQRDFVDYVEKRLGKKGLTYEQEIVTIRWK